MCTSFSFSVPVPLTLLSDSRIAIGYQQHLLSPIKDFVSQLLQAVVTKLCCLGKRVSLSIEKRKKKVSEV